MFFVVPVTSHLSRMFVCLVLLHELCTLGSLSLSLSLFLFLPFLSSFLPFPSLFFSALGMLVLLSVLHVFSPCLPLSLCAGDVLFQMAEVHRQIQVQLEEMVGILSSKGFLAVWFNTAALSIKLYVKGQTRQQVIAAIMHFSLLVWLRSMMLHNKFAQL